MVRRPTGPFVAAALLAVPALASAACTPEVGEDAVTVESCPIEHTGYRLVRSRTTAAGTVGGVVLDIVGADDLATDLEGTRVLCLRSRWTITPAGAAGTVAILQETVSDPRPPFGLTGLVTAETARVMHGMLRDLRPEIGSSEQSAGPDVSSWPLLGEPLPDVSARFASCHLGSWTARGEASAGAGVRFLQPAQVGVRIDVEVSARKVDHLERGTVAQRALRAAVAGERG